jgi:hypothetical protein
MGLQCAQDAALMKILLLAMVFGSILLMAHYGSAMPNRTLRDLRLRRLMPFGDNHRR